MAKCSHCGTILHSSKDPRNNNRNLMLMKLAALIIIVALVLMFLSNKPSNAIKEDKKSSQQNVKVPKKQVSLNSIPKLNSNALVITNQEVQEYHDKITNPELKVISKIKGKTLNGGVYWIITVKNENSIKIARPGVIMSLFDDQEKRIDELRIWSKKNVLLPNETAVVLVNLSKPPLENFTTKTIGMAKIPGSFDRLKTEIKVSDFLIKPLSDNNNSVDIIGEVKNLNTYQVDYVEVIAIAYNKNSQAVGIANSFASISSLKPKEISGFKIRAGTFIAQKPDKWKLWAFGRQHK